MKSLYDNLIDYNNSDFYPFHMPGHKRRLKPMEGAEIYGIDITEIDGFDNLHHPVSVLKEAEERAAALYGAEETHFLVNGSTAGILSAVSGCTGRGGHILMARNCHKAAYHGAELRGLRISYLYPEWDERFGMNGSISPQAVRAAFEKYGTEKAGSKRGGIQAVLITSPTYDGVISDIRGIASVVHEFGIPLIVDEAHGAHLGFHEYFPKSAVLLGADVVIQSLHKTMPCLTQTALIHMNGKLADRKKVRKYLGIYQTSSPSYVLMSAMDSCIGLMERDGRGIFEEYAGKLQKVRRKLSELSGIHLVGQEDMPKGFAYGMDPSKLILAVPPMDGVLRGKWLSDVLRERYHLELEMAAGGYALAMTGPGDTEEGFDRLSEALTEIAGMKEILNRENWDRRSIAGYRRPPVCRAVISLGGTEEYAVCPMALTESAGHIAGEYIYLYPPGTPLVVPGERIPRELVDLLLEYREAGFSLEGLADEKGEKIQVLDA